MIPDPILEEIHRAKESVAAKNGFDIQKMVEDMMKRQGKDGREEVKLPPRKTEAGQTSFTPDREYGTRWLEA